MKRPSIIFFNRVYPPVRGASGRMLRDLARTMAREGWHVTVVTTGTKRGRERDGSVHVVRLKGAEKPKVFGYVWIWIKMLIKGLRLPRRHVVVTMTDPPFVAALGCVVAKLKKSRHIHWCQDLYPDVLPALGMSLPGFMQDRLRGITGRAIKSTDRTIVIGRCMAKQLSGYEMDPRRITVIPNWPDLELLEGASPDIHVGDAVKQSTTAPPKALIKETPKFRVLYAGNIGKAHPVDSILEAASLLQEEHPEIEFMFVGDGPRFDYIAKERDRLRLDNIRLVSYQPASRLRTLMESGDVHLISMKDEAAGCIVPSKLYSALAVGRPCIFIGPKQCEAAKIIRDFKAGKVVPQGKPKKVAEAIRHLRLSGEEWFSAQQGAGEAGSVFLPSESINAWIERAWDVAQPDLDVKTDDWKQHG